jgi:predicted Zn-dependent peptidase
LYKKTTLENGLRILTSTMPHTRSVSLSFFIGVGSRYETEVESGTSHFIEHLCFRGTAKRPTASDISGTIEGVGGIFNGATDKELTVYWCKVAQPHFPLALEVITDMLLNSKLAPEDIEKERLVITEEIGMSKDFPSQRVDMLIDELLWPNHPLGRDIAGTEESVGNISRDSIIRYMANHYQPDNTVVAAAGDIQHEEIVAAVSHVLGTWSGQQPLPGYAAYLEHPGPRLRVEIRDTEQAHLCLALPGIPLLHPKRFTLDLINVILGEGMSSRLFTEIRDRLGLAYNVHSYAEHFLDSGSVTIYASVEPKNLKTAIEAILRQLDRFNQTVPAAELSKAKEFTKGRLLLRMEDSRGVAGWIGGQEILTGNILSIDKVLSVIDDITADEIKQLADELLVGSRLRLAVVGPVKNDESLDELLKI